jgi:hypothetical protein
MTTAAAAIALTLIAILKIGMFAVSVRNAIRPRPLPIPQSPVDPDGPDDGWKWWEEFEPEPNPPEPVDSVDKRDKVPL